MLRGHSLCMLLMIALTLPLRALAVEPATQPVSPGDLPVIPVVQLTEQQARFLDHNNFVGCSLLRELQRQAVLIAARDELGLATRDMVLGEPFTTHQQNAVTTVLFESRIWRDDQAQICLSHFNGKQPTDPYALADMQVDKPGNLDAKWVSFKIPKGAVPNYLDFVTHAEEASRTSYQDALKAQNVLGEYSPRPIQWAASPAPADPQALLRLQNFDVFSQYLAVRLLHAQIRSDGASDERITALVRGYANLSALTRDQWSRANKAFLARALLYSQRLAAHDRFSAPSLYARAYARCFAGLHAGALADLDNAAKSNDGPPATAPPWAGLIEAMSRYDPLPLEDAIAAGPWQYRELATFLDVNVAADKFPEDRFSTAVDQALDSYPAMFVFAPLSTRTGDERNAKPSDTLINVVPVVVGQMLRDAKLPSSVMYNGLPVKDGKRTAIAVSPGDNSFKQLALLRDRLNTAASRSPRDLSEPSLGVLADLIEQQEMVALIHKAINTRTTSGMGEVQKLVQAANPILKAHRWGPYVESISKDSSNDSALATQLLAKIKERDPGAWVHTAFTQLDGIPNDAGTRAIQTSASATADYLQEDYVANNFSYTEPVVTMMCWMNPHSATLMEAWLRQMPIDRVLRDNDLYTHTLQRVEEEFTDRPAVVMAAYDWCNARGEYQRSLKLMQQVDKIDPSAQVCDHMAHLYWRLGKHDMAIAQLMRAVKLGEPNETAAAYLQAAVYLIEDHRYVEAMNCVQLSSEIPSPRVWQLMVRCYEAMGQLDDADECLRQQAINDPSAIEQHYLWAKRLGRKNTKEIRHRAIAGQIDYMPRFYMAMADDQERKAIDSLRQLRPQMNDAFQVAQLAILSKKQSDTYPLNDLLGNITNMQNGGFGSAFRSLALSKDVTAGVAAFDTWVKGQLDDEDAVDWYSLAGRFLIAQGHIAEGKAYLIRTLHQSAHEREDYYLAWRELTKLGENPQKLLATPITQD